MTTTAQGAAKVAEANRQATSGQVGGAVTASGQIVSAGGQVVGAANPKDLSTYTPGTSTDDKVGPITAQTQALDKSLPTTVTPPSPITPTTPTQLDPNAQAPQGMVDQVKQATDTATSLSQQYALAHKTLQNSGVAPAQNAGAGSAGVTQTMKAVAPQTQPLPDAVTNFLNPENAAVQESTKQLLEFLNPQADRKMLDNSISQLASDRAELSGLKTDLMDTKRVMAGTEQDLRDEITKAGGFATDSQVQALTIARNKGLLQKAQLLSDQIQSQTDLVNSDVSIVSDEKQLASQQFNQRMSLINYQQENTKNAYNALKDSYKTMMENNPGGLYNSLLSDPTQAQRFQAITGLNTDSLKGMADTKAVEAQVKQAQLQGLLLDNNKKTTDAAGSTGDKAQQKLEQDYRQVLVKEVSSRAGTIGTEDGKVAQANHLASLMNQYYDPITGDYSVPKAQYGELVLGLAGMISKTGTPSDSQVENILQKTAKGDIAGAISYVTGNTPTGTTQAVLKNLADSINRQAETAVQNREAGLKVLRGLAPTDLEQSRRDALEKNTLVPYAGIKTKEKASAPVLSNGIDLSKFFK